MTLQEIVRRVLDVKIFTDYDENSICEILKHRRFEERELLDVDYLINAMLDGRVKRV